MRVFRVHRRAAVAVVATVLLLGGGAVAYTATVPNPDPCDSTWSASGTTNERLTKLRNYVDCRSDRIERAIPEKTVTVPGPTVTVTGPTSTTSTTTSSTSSTTASSTTTTTPPAGGFVVLGRTFPDSTVTGVPEGVTLTPYTGSCLVNVAGTVIDGKTVNCELRIFAKDVVIRNSVINGKVYADFNDNVGSFTITDSEVRAATDWPDTGIGDAYFTAERVEVTGGSRSINCYAKCTVKDSYVHGQMHDQSGVNHESGVRINLDSNLLHNTIVCDAPNFEPDAGCSAAITGYPDFDPVQRNRVENNLIDASAGAGYCAYGGATTGKPYSGQERDITFKDNIFKRGTRPGQGGVFQCGYWGPITSFNSAAPGAVWANNVFDDGAVIPPAN